MYIMLGPIPLYILHTFFLNIFIRRDLLAHDLMMTVGKAEGQAQHTAMGSANTMNMDSVIKLVSFVLPELLHQFRFMTLRSSTGGSSTQK